MRTGCTWVLFGFILCSTLTFYTQQWEEYHTHVLRTFIGKLGVTEILLLIIGLIYICAFTDGVIVEWSVNDISPWQFPESIGALAIPELAAIFGVVSGIQYVYGNVKEVLAKT